MYSCIIGADWALSIVLILLMCGFIVMFVYMIGVQIWKWWQQKLKQKEQKTNEQKRKRQKEEEENYGLVEEEEGWRIKENGTNTRNDDARKLKVCLDVVSELFCWGRREREGEGEGGRGRGRERGREGREGCTCGGRGARLKLMIDLLTVP
jgi:hypothetical protein